MGARIILRNVDFSKNAVSVLPEMEDVLIGTSESLWSYANTKGAGGAFGFIVPQDCYVTGVYLVSAEGNENCRVSVYQRGNNVPLTSQYFDVVTGHNKIEFDTPILVEAGQCIAVQGTNVWYCEPEVQEGDYPTNSYNGLFMEPPYRCFRMNFYGLVYASNEENNG